MSPRSDCANDRSALCSPLFARRCCAARALLADLLGQTRGVGARVELLSIVSGLGLSRRLLVLGHGGLLRHDCSPDVRITRSVLSLRAGPLRPLNSTGMPWVDLLRGTDNPDALGQPGVAIAAALQPARWRWRRLPLISHRSTGLCARTE